MQQLIYFIVRYRYLFFFLILEAIAISLIFNNHDFHKSKFLNSSNRLAGSLYASTRTIKDYFGLRGENAQLLSENLFLKNRIEKLKHILNQPPPLGNSDFPDLKTRYSYIKGKVEKNQYSNKHNFLTINLGKVDGVFDEMGVINSRGIIGITEIVSTNYSRVQSILNKNSRINAKPKNSHYFGSLIWNGLDYNTVQLSDLPRHAILKTGDTIITGGMSSIFPEGIPIGKIVNIDQWNSIDRVVDVRLFNDMSNLREIYVIKDFDMREIRDLESITQ